MVMLFVDPDALRPENFREDKFNLQHSLRLRLVNTESRLDPDSRCGRDKFDLQLLIR